MRFLRTVSDITPNGVLILRSTWFGHRGPVSLAIPRRVVFAGSHWSGGVLRGGPAAGGAAAEAEVLGKPAMATRERLHPGGEVDAAGGQVRGRCIPALGEKVVAAVFRVVPALVHAVVLVEPLDFDVLVELGSICSRCP